MNLSTTTGAKQVSRWIGAVAAAAVVALIAGAAIWWVWSFMSRPRQADLAEVAPGRGMGAPGRGGGWDGVRQNRNGNYMARAGEFLMVAAKGKNPNQWDLRMNFPGQSLFSPEDTAALTARMQILANPVWVKSLNLSPDQLKQLKQIPGGNGLIVSDADLARLRQLFEAYLAPSLPKDQTENDLLLAVREVGNGSLASTRASGAERAARVREILTAEQISHFMPQK